MTLDEAVQVIADSPTEPPADVVEHVLHTAQSLDGLLVLIDALKKSPRPWSARLILLAAIRLATADSVDHTHLSELSFDLLKIVTPLAEWSADSGCLDLLSSLNDNPDFPDLQPHRREAVQDLFTRAIRSDHPNAWIAASGCLEQIVDFGQPWKVLSTDAIRSLRDEALQQLLDSGPHGDSQALSEFVELTREADDLASTRMS